MSFYLTLPSNSSFDYFPRNNPSHFITKLPQEINLDADYEVGLSEIQFNNTYVTSKKNSIFLHYESPSEEDQASPDYINRKIVEDGFTGSGGYTFEPPVFHQIILPSGVFASNKDFVKQLNEKIKEKIQEKVIIYYNSSSKTVTIKIKEVGARVRLSNTLHSIFGYEPEITFTGPSQTESYRPMDIYQDFKSIFVYSDIVSPRAVGDQMVPLLRTLPISNQKLDIYHQIFIKPHYIPISRRNFHTLEVLLSTDSGLTLPVSNGHSIVTLHFRKKIK